MHYYKDKVFLRGTIRLCAKTNVVKTGRDKFEIVTPTRTFYLSEDEGNRLSSDIWIEKIREVVLGLKKWVFIRQMPIGDVIKYDS